MDLVGGRITIARQTLQNPDFQLHDPGPAPGTGCPFDWAKYSAVSAYQETSSLFWPPAHRATRQTLRLDVFSLGSYTHGIYQYLWGGGTNMHNPEFYNLAAPGCHTARFSAWVYVPDSTNAPNSGDIYLSIINVCCHGGGNVHSPYMTDSAGWHWLRTGVTYWAASGGIDVRTLDWYARVSKVDYDRTGTFWMAQARLWLDEIHLDVSWSAKHVGRPHTWRYKGAEGGIHARHVGQRDRWTLPIINVSSEHRHRLHSWWREGAPLVMTFQSSIDLSSYLGFPEEADWYFGLLSNSKQVPQPFHDVMIGGGKSPLVTLDGMGHDRFRGTLDLRTIEGGHPRRTGEL